MKTSKSTQWIQTGPRRTTDPLHPDVRWNEVAHSLASQVRYGGHMPEHFSIAEHCCRVHDYIEARGFNTETCLVALIHDATEAYCSDLQRPIKRRLPAYKQIENRIEHYILDAAGLDGFTVLDKVSWLLLKEADNEALIYEVTAAWGKDADPGWFELFGPVCPGSLASQYLTPMFWDRAKAKKEYLKRLAKYGLGEATE